MSEASVPMQSGCSLRPVKNTGWEEKSTGAFFITLFPESNSLAGSLFSFTNSKYSCTLITSSVVTGDYISQKTWYMYFYRITLKQGEVSHLGDEPGFLGTEAAYR